jgi:hypothetical protein
VRRSAPLSRRAAWPPRQPSLCTAAQTRNTGDPPVTQEPPSSAACEGFNRKRDIVSRNRLNPPWRRESERLREGNMGSSPCGSSKRWDFPRTRPASACRGVTGSGCIAPCTSSAMSRSRSRRGGWPPPSHTAPKPSCPTAAAALHGLRQDKPREDRRLRTQQIRPPAPRDPCPRRSGPHDGGRHGDRRHPMQDVVTDAHRPGRGREPAPGGAGHGPRRAVEDLRPAGSWKRPLLERRHAQAPR